MNDKEFLDSYIDLLTKEFFKEDIIRILCRKWEIDYLYGTTMKMLVDSRKKISRNALSRTNRRLIVKALDEGKCQYCGSDVTYFEIDHIIPIEELGEDSLDNICTADHMHNRMKSDSPRADMLKIVAERRKDVLYKKAIELFNSKAGRKILLNFLTFEEEE